MRFYTQKSNPSLVRARQLGHTSFPSSATTAAAGHGVRLQRRQGGRARVKVRLVRLRLGCRLLVRRRQARPRPVEK